MVLETKNEYYCNNIIWTGPYSRSVYIGDTDMCRAPFAISKQYINIVHVTAMMILLLYVLIIGTNIIYIMCMVYDNATIVVAFMQQKTATLHAYDIEVSP